MLKLEKMKISGFKSFADHIEVSFQEGITAVVGPNGCGKSNIGDAINWVLGEQSPRMLRGSSMQDVIFNGSESRRAQGLAEVSLQLMGPNGAGNGEAQPLTITRRLFRSGESEYLVNGTKSRLRDIQDLLREERVGAQTYATIEQGRIDQILNSKPKDRRLIVEEAAGIAGFKHKRRLAELKLEATQANLLRVNDILLEVRRQINSLKRQAAKARRYQRLRDELRSKEAVRFGAKAAALDAELGRRREAESAARAAEAESAAALATLESGLVEQRLALEEAERSARAIAEALHLVDLEVDRDESRIRSARERIAEAETAGARLAAEAEGLEERLSGLREEARGQDARLAEGDTELVRAEASVEARHRELEEAERRVAEGRARVDALRRSLFKTMNALVDARNRRRAAEESLDRGRAQRSRLEAELEGCRLELGRADAEAESLRAEAEGHRRGREEVETALRSAEAALAEARERLQSGSVTLASAREEEKSAQARLATLEDVTTRFAGVSDGVKTILSSGPAAGIRTLGVVADYVEATAELEGPAEAYLQSLLPAVVVEDDADARRAAELLRGAGAGRTLLVCRSQPSGALAIGGRADAGLPEPLRGDARVLGRLRDGITLKQPDGFVSDRIGDAVVVDGLESALHLHRMWPHADYLTPSGEVVYSSGIVAAGGRHEGDQHGLLAHNRMIVEARARASAASAASQILQGRVDEARSDVTRLEADVERGRRALEDAGRAGFALDLRAQRTAEDRVRTRRRAEVLAGEIEALAAEEAALAARHAALGDEVARNEEGHGATEAALAVEAAALEGHEQALRALAEQVAVMRTEAGALRQRQQAARRERERLEESLREVEARRSEVARAREEAAGRGAEAAEILRATEQDLVARLEARRVGGLELAAAEEGIAARRAALAERESGLRDARASLDRARDEARDAEMERVRVESDRRHLDDLCGQELGMSAAEAAAAAGEGALAAALPEDLDAVIAELRGRIDAIGPVKLTAIEEFAGLEERHTFLAAQQKDLEESMASLRESIRRINRTSRERFLEVFEKVRASYAEIFRVLFNGGRADLVLEEGEDVLDCGIDMIAQPPGKRLGHVSLLSGGEKAMAAIALLFAIFRIQPSPFCLLDEVDAALDETNVGRFTRMLREYASQTQFIIITHNKRSMEAANLLYGVTMEEAGVSKIVSLRI